MSRQSERFSLGEFSDFFNNDQSDGHRLAEFLQKKKGVTTRKRHILVDYDPGPINLNVQVVKVNPQSTANKGQPIATLQHNEQDGTATITAPNTKSPTSTETHQKGSTNEHKKPESAEQNVGENPITGNLPISSKPRSTLVRMSAIKNCGSPASPSDRLRRYSLKRLSSVGRRTLLKEFESTINLSSFKPPVCSTPCHSDLNNQPHSALNHNVLPIVSQNIISKTVGDESGAESSASSNFNTMQNLQRKDDELKEMLKAVHDTTQKIYRDQSQSPARRTFNVEKVPETGQIILTPTKKSSMKLSQLQLNNSDTVIPQTDSQISQTVLPRTKNQFEEPTGPQTPSNKTFAHETIVPNTTERRLSVSGNVRANGCQETEELIEKGQQLLNTTPQNDPVRMVVCVSVQRDNLTSTHTTETANEAPPGTPQSSRVQSPVQLEKSRDGNRSQMTVMITAPAEPSCAPITPLRPGTIGYENVHNCPMRTPVRPPSSSKFVSPYKMRSTESRVPLTTPVRSRGVLTQEQITKEINSAYGPNYENIMTDDEDDMVASNRGNTPLNLASCSGSTRTRKLRTRSTVARRSRRIEKSPITSTETEMGPPLAHPVIASRIEQRTLNGDQKRRVLNKAPRTPINGEKFAAELGRMTNHEILDLRKRNSLGQVFPISGRKSQSEKKEALEKRNQLEEKLKIEIRKRHIDTDNTEEESQGHDKVEANHCDAASSYTDTVQLFSERGKSPMSKLLDTIIRRDRDLSPLYGAGSNDRVTFGGAKDQTYNDDAFNDTKRTSRRRRVHAPEVKDYLALVKEVKSRSKSHMDQSTKRLLYTKGQSDCEEQSPESPKAHQPKTPQIDIVPSPPLPMTAQPEFKIPSPPPRKSQHSKNLVVDASPTLAPTIQEWEGAIEVIPPPKLFTDRENSLRESISNGKNKGNQIYDSVCTAETELTKPMSSSFNPSPNEEARMSDNDLTIEVETFKKPSRRPPKSKKQNSTQASEQTLTTDADSSSLRRSKRGHVPLKNTWSFRNKDPTPLFLLKYQEQMRRIEKQNNKNDTKKSHASVYAELPIASSTVNSVKVSAKKPRGRSKKVAAALPQPIDRPEGVQYASSEKLQSLPVIPEVLSDGDERSKKNSHKDLAMNVSSNNVGDVNELFDQLKNSEDQEDQHMLPPQLARDTPLLPGSSVAGSKTRTTKKLRVCVKRTPMPNEKCNSRVTRERSLDNKATTLHNLHNMSVQTEISESNFKNNASTQSSELLTWLKGVQDIQETTGAEKIFKEMHCYAADTLAFNDLEGVDYAFYDTDDKASLGYLRFKPHQTKPAKRTTKYNLHFVVLHGLFEIVTNGETGMFPAGDMVVIKTGSLYKIQNISNDVGILMVIKK